MAVPSKQAHNWKLPILTRLRNVLDLEKSVKDNVSEGSDFVDVNGQRRHIYSYLQDFLFSPERARTPVKALSGGERNRVLLAKLYAETIQPNSDG